MKKIGFISGWFGKSNLKEYFGFDDGRSDMVVRLLDELKKDYHVITDRKKILQCKDIDYEIHLNCQRFVTSARTKICILLEDASIRPQNNLVLYKNQYDVVLTWNLDLLRKLDNGKHFYFPHDCHLPSKPENKTLFLSNISSNRNVLLGASRELYSSRYKDILYFDEHESEFELYGYGWDKSFLRPGLLSRIIEEFDKRGIPIRSRRNLRSYMGTIKAKRDVISKSIFSMAYENVSGLNGYITEKILDCFADLTIPIYLPSYEIPENVIPKSCFIDRRQFSTPKELHEFLRAMTKEELDSQRAEIKKFMNNNVKKFSVDNFIFAVKSAL